ncbi:MAG: (Fe-S)-binding protein [Clostridia bacterium]|nr:(Fe-S)-binding protein [Clostridia bacterium]
MSVAREDEERREASPAGAFPALERRAQGGRWAEFGGEAAAEQIAHCIKCGFCLPACPTYALTQREAASPRGRLALVEAVREGRIEPDAWFAEQMYFCLGCRACESACPSGVRYGEVLEAARAELARLPGIDPLGPVGRALLQAVEHPTLLRLIGRLGRWYQRDPLARRLGEPLLRTLPGGLDRMAPMLPETVDAEDEEVESRGTPAHAGAAAGPLPEVGWFPGCVSEALFEPVNRATVALLRAAGYPVRPLGGAPCCGALHAHAGDENEAARLARRNIAAWEAAGRPLVAENAGGCGAFLGEYGRLLAGDPEWAERAALFSRSVRDWSQLVALEPVEPPEAPEGAEPEAGPAGEPPAVTYQDSCHLRHGQHVFREPREILASLPGYRYVEMEGADRCCGSAGIYNFTHQEASMALLDGKMEAVGRSGAQVVAVANPGCYLQMRLGASRAGRGGELRVAHVAELAWETVRRGTARAVPRPAGE